MIRLGTLETARRIDLDAATAADRWADIGHAEDVSAMRGLAQAVMGDIRRKRSWEIAWKVATRAAYGAIYQPFGLYMDESNHLADRIGDHILARSDLAAMQRLYTLSHAGCSTVMAWDRRQGHMVHFRSLDWPSASAIAAASRIYVGHRANREVFAAAGLLGMVGFLTAVKPGFSIAINFAPWRGTSFSLNADPTFLIRRLMESPISTYAQAYQHIKDWRPGAPVFISLCGIAKGEACIFEFGTRGQAHVGAIGRSRLPDPDQPLRSRLPVRRAHEAGRPRTSRGDHQTLNGPAIFGNPCGPGGRFLDQSFGPPPIASANGIRT
uniref:Uncharacterized protein n=1 Tax=Magnetospirillum gryphiswaldense TaxID=55518 RepID=A4TTS1_9PROT|nr:hypothetical protein MGR_0210 [Magnetospirillum gryphiswaldense MSR-1]